jgi:putative DNA methylase
VNIAVQPGTPSGSVPRRKLIEVSLPLADINAESAREKTIKHGHPSTLHLWWARRPLAAARAVLFAQLVDDPSSHPDAFPTEDEQKAERERLHGIIRRLVKWENLSDRGLYREARQEIHKSTGGNPPAILDPFAGGGTIPLEAQRLGLEAHASDLNPVPVLINKALIEIPPKFSGQPPVFPGAAGAQLTEWSRAAGLAEDVRRYGAWMRDRAQERIGYLYPKAQVPVLGLEGEPTGRHSEATVIAWLWARTVQCPNPACGIRMPLARSWWLSKKKGKEAYVVPRVIDDATAPGGRRVAFHIGHGRDGAPNAANNGTVGRQGAHCIACQSAVDLKYIRAESRAKRMGEQLMAIVAEGTRSRIYLAPTDEHVKAATVARPDNAPAGSLPDAALGFRVQGYGMTEWADLFSKRQLTALTAFIDLIPEVREQVLKDALDAGLPRGENSNLGEATAETYADSVATYLAMTLSRLADISNALCAWEPIAECPRHLFGRQAIPMTWDHAEGNVLGNASGSWSVLLTGAGRAFESPAFSFGDIASGSVTQTDASARDYANTLVSTDPPYYDNIGYADLSDFFYVWLRRALRSIHPTLFGTMLVPKAEELVAEPFRHGGTEQAERFFEDGFQRVFSKIRESADSYNPITVFYAFKQAELDKDGVASTGWSTFLEGMIGAGWTITATWPVRTENASRLRGQGSNALASSIVLALRPREVTAPTTDRAGFLLALHEELEEALPRIREGALAPVDLRQTIIGPGMAVFSRFSRVLEDDGSTMSVKTALALINQTFDALQNEHDAELDADTRFCLDWFRSYGWDTRPYGDAESLAVPLGLSVDGIARSGTLTSGGGKVALIRPLDLAPRWDPAHDDRLSLWEVTCHLARAYATEGREEAARLMAGVKGKVDLDEVNRLATRLYELMESQDASTAGLFNGLGGAWADVSATSTTIRPAAVAETLFGEEI